MVVADNSELADRVRLALAAQPSVREVKMFGGLSFMVSERMVVSVRGDADLLVRVDPERYDELLAATGARPAEMGEGRAMGKGWIAVDRAAMVTDEDLAFWIGVALEHHGRKAGDKD